MRRKYKSILAHLLIDAIDLVEGKKMGNYATVQLDDKTVLKIEINKE